jgi:hypothetical protein
VPVSRHRYIGTVRRIPHDTFRLKTTQVFTSAFLSVLLCMCVSACACLRVRVCQGCVPHARVWLWTRVFPPSDAVLLCLCRLLLQVWR